MTKAKARMIFLKMAIMKTKLNSARSKKKKKQKPWTFLAARAARIRMEL